MFFAEARRKYFNIVFLLIAAASGFWLYSALKPRASTTYDYYKYNYFKPLNKAEFVYFELVSDYNKGFTTAFYEPKGKGMWGTYEVKLNNTSKEYFLDVIKKINPSYHNSEKMKDVKINISYAGMQPYLKELEEKLNIYSLYYTGMNSPVYYVKGYGYSSHNSPYYIYRDCTMRFQGKKYKDALKDFNIAYKHGISGGYARLALDNLGIIMGLITIIYSFMSYTEEKKMQINGYIYTSSTSSVKFVLCKYLANVVPLMLLSVIYILFEAVCFMYWNYSFNYGYNISVIPFLTQMPLAIFPTILITAATGHLLGILLQSVTAIIIQFVLFFLSFGGILGGKLNLNIFIRYYYFDDYNFYQEHYRSILTNRIIMTILSIVLTACVVLLFDYRREHDKLININKITKRCKNLLPGIYKEKEQNLATRSLVYYIFLQSVSKSVLLYIPYLLIMYSITLYRNVNVTDIALSGENIIIFASLFLFINLGNIEQKNGTTGFVFTSNTSYLFLYLSRVAAACVVLFIMVLLPVLFLCLVNHVSIGRWFAGVYISSLFIGMFALLITEISEKYFAGYFSYIIYYLFDKVLGSSMLLSISGYTYNIRKSKLHLGIAVIVFVIILSIITYARQKGTRITGRWK